MSKEKIIIMIFALVFVIGCAKNDIPTQFQDDRLPRPVMYEKVEI